MSNITLSVRYSDDGGQNWSSWQDLDGGNTGTFLPEMTATQLGITRQRLWEFRDTSPVASDIIGADIRVVS
jgi:hypothetical protein